MEVLIVNDMDEARILLKIKIGKGESIYGLILLNQHSEYIGTNAKHNEVKIVFDGEDALACEEYYSCLYRK